MADESRFVDRLLEDKYKRRVFYAVLTLVIISTLLARVYLVPDPGGAESWADIYRALGVFLEAFFATSMTTLVISALFFLLTPSWAKRADIEVIYGHQINPLINRAQRRTSKWLFSGGLGRYNTSVTIPELAEQASQRNISIDVTLVIIHPNEIGVCREYSRYKNRLRSNSNSEWDTQKVQHEAIATLAIAALWNARPNPINIKVGLKRNFSTFRIDLSSEYAIITKEDPKEPALKADEGTFFYNSYREEIRSLLSQSIELENRLTIDNLSSNSISKMMEDLPIDKDSIDDDGLGEVSCLAKNRENPYS